MLVEHRGSRGDLEQRRVSKRYLCALSAARGSAAAAVCVCARCQVCNSQKSTFTCIKVDSSVESSQLHCCYGYVSMENKGMVAAQQELLLENIGYLLDSFKLKFENTGFSIQIGVFNYLLH